MISLQRVINSSLSLRLVSVLAQRLSPRLGYPIADFVAEFIARQRNSRVVRAMRANQWIVHGETLPREPLDAVVRETLRYSARCLFDLYHYIENAESAGRLIVLEPSFQQLFQRPEFDQRGLVIIGLHLSNFDLVLQWLCRQGMKPLAVTIPDPQGGRRLEYEMRKKNGIRLLPASVGAIRQAVRHLQEGGMVLTGIDRPIPEPEMYPRFFGHPAALPVHHVFLASKARVPLIIAVTRLQEDGKYHVLASDPIEMDSHSGSQMALIENAEKVLGVAEGFIRQTPRQWSVPLPVWPQFLDRAPM